MPGRRSAHNQSRAADIAAWNEVAVDRMIDSYVVWRKTCARLRSAYAAWDRGGARLRP
jgi:hypothetical protein